MRSLRVSINSKVKAIFANLTGSRKIQRKTKNEVCQNPKWNQITAKTFQIIN